MLSLKMHAKAQLTFSYVPHTHTLELFMVAKWTVIIISLPQSSLRDKHLLTIQLKVRIFPEVFSLAIGVTTPAFVSLLYPALTLTPIRHTLSSTFYRARNTVGVLSMWDEWKGQEEG